MSAANVAAMTGDRSRSWQGVTLVVLSAFAFSTGDLARP